MEHLTPESVLKRYRTAKSRRSVWEAHWQECYDFALPQRDGFNRAATAGEKKSDRIFDGTAADAVDQLAASMLAQLTPPWSRWFGLTAGNDIDPADRDAIAPVLDDTATILQSHFDRSNFTVEMHQCYLDLITGGTASLLMEETATGDDSAFRFTSVPLSQAVLEEGAGGRLDISFRRSELTLAQIRARFPRAEIPGQLLQRAEQDPDARFALVEAVLPVEGGYEYMAVLEEFSGEGDGTAALATGRFDMSPFINFRWLKAPGESYGRSPVMKALPDIKTANKVVELVLKNASIAVTGIWQADDDGVLNPANIRLTPGTIIPKAVGSKGLTPLESPGRFDISQLVLEDLRARIRHALLADRLGRIDDQRMTATEVLERSAETARILGATYGRLQSELLTPLIRRGMAILKRRGEIPDLVLDGRTVDLQYRSPLAQDQARQDVQQVMLWLDSAAGLGPEALSAIDLPATVRWMGRSFNVPGELIREESSTDPVPELLEGLMAEAAPLVEALAVPEQETPQPMSMEDDNAAS
ncbi:MAG: head-tail connector protein [Alphaproteobacteria bacterium]|nr:head-tail connector protein [Alphaproteobacteria bacterium]